MPVSGWTIALQAINFLILVWLLNRFLYKPVARMIAGRQQQIEDAFGRAAAREQAAEQEQGKYQALIAGIDVERQRVIADAKNEAEDEGRNLIERARAQAKDIRAATQRDLEKERNALTAAAGDWAVDTAVTLSAQLLSAVAPEAPIEVFFERIVTDVRALAGERREDLRASLAEGGEILVLTSRPLAEADQRRWQERLRGELEVGVRACFETDPSLVAGVEMRFPHIVIAHSWRDALKTARDRMNDRARSH